MLWGGMGYCGGVLWCLMVECCEVLSDGLWWSVVLLLYGGVV